MKIKIFVVIISLFLLLSVSTVSLLSLYGTTAPISSSAQSSTNATGVQGFEVINAVWGTSTSTVDAGPGNQNVPLALTLEYLYQYSSISAELEIQLPPGFSPTPSEASQSSSSSNNATIYYPDKLSEGEVFEVQLYVNLANNLTLGQHTLPTEIFWYALLSNSTSQPEVSLVQQTNVVVSLNGDPDLSFSTQTNSLVPGEINYVPITLSNSGSGNVSDVSTTVTESSGQSISVLNELPEVNTLDANSSVPESLQLYVSSAASGASLTLTFSSTYLDSYDNQQTATQTLGMYVESNPVNGSQITYKARDDSLSPGQVNNITLTVTNDGSQSLTDISTEASANSQSVSILSQPTNVQSLPVGSSANVELGVFISESAANTPLSIALSTTYYVAGTQVSSSSSQNVGMYVASSNSTDSSTSGSLSVSTIESTLETGEISPVSFVITNHGTAPVYNPTFSLSLSSPLVVSANASYTYDGEVQPNSSLVYEASIITSPSASIGAYAGNLDIAYTNQYGISSTMSTGVGFVLTGTIELVIQDETISLSSGNLTVTGSLLNEGTASAYYASASGNVGSGTDPGPVTYIGEIDPNTPVPFSATIPYSSTKGGTIKVNLVITYKDSFGNNESSTSTESTTVSPSVASTGSPTGSSSTGSSSSGEALVRLVLYAMVALVVASGLIGMIMVRRRRGAGGTSKEEEEGSSYSEDQKVV